MGYRISPEELEQPGITLDDTLALIDALKATKIDYLHVSQSDVWRTSLRDPDNPAIINDVIRDHVAGALPIIVVGGIKTEEAEKAAAAFDLVAIGHEMIREPHWVQKFLPTTKRRSAIRSPLKTLTSWELRQLSSILSKVFPAVLKAFR